MVAVIVAVAKVVFAGVVVYAFVDPAWALPVQTALLILLAVIQSRTHSGVKQVDAKVDEAKLTATHAASAAAAAAAVARDSNRIVKEIGSVFRNAEVVAHTLETPLEPTPAPAPAPTPAPDTPKAAS